MSSPSTGSSSSPAGRRPQPLPRLGNISFPCSDCDQTFSTHQALGGHRKLHTKLLDPEVRKQLRRQRRKKPTNVFSHGRPPPTVALGPMHPEKEEWCAVKVKTFDHGFAGGSMSVGQFIGFVEANGHGKQPCATLKSAEEIPMGMADEVVKKEIDLTLHL